MPLGAVRAICFDLDNTLWEIEPVLMRAERILADWLERRYPRIPERFRRAEMLEMRAALLANSRTRRTIFHYLRRETLARLRGGGGLRAGHGARGVRALACRAQPARAVRRGDSRARDTQARASGSRRSATAMPTSARIGLAHHFEVSLSAGALGCAKPDPRAYARARRRADTQTRGNTVCRRRTPCGCGRSADSWHANCMGE